MRRSRQSSDPAGRPRRRASARLILALPALLLLGAGASDAGAAEAAPTPAAAVYRPPAAHPAPRRIGGAARGVSASLPAIAVLAPDHLGLTQSVQPRLYWFISAPSRARVEFALIRPGIDTPLVETALDASAAGIHALDLAALGTRLELDVEYEWSVALVPDPEQRSRDVVAGAAIMRVAPLAAAGPADAAAYAQSGLWYDALMALDEAAGAQDTSVVRARRAALLEQAGLPEVARFERR